jgi:hypothetical protein
MIICQVDARVSGMGKEDIERELRLLEDVLAALDGELIGAEVGVDQQSLVAYVRAESELIVGDIFEASNFTAERIAYLGQALDTPIDANRPVRLGMWRYRPGLSAHIGQSRHVAAL